MLGVSEAFAALPPRLLVGFSGGADSTALMCLLLRERGPQGLIAAHVNHGLRGAAADADETFVRAFCEEHGVILFVSRLIPPEKPSENWAREARWAFFRQTMADCAADALVLAHQRDDQAETLLMRLMRGSGLRGLGGMAADAVKDGVRVIRPLLSVAGHRELCAYLEELGQDWREDATNAEETFLRNRVRGELLPLMERLQPGAAYRLAQTAQSLRQDEEALHEASRRLLRQADLGGPLRLRDLLCAPEAVGRRALREWWCRRGGRLLEERTLDYQATDRLWRLAKAGRPGDRLTLAGGMNVYRGYTALHLLSGEDRSGAVPITGEGAALNGIRLRLTKNAGGRGLQTAHLAECLLRTRQTGDWLRTADGRHRRSLQDYLVDARVDAPWRDGMPLICRGREVLCVPGLYEGGLTGGPEETLRVDWEGYLPWTDA